MIKPRFVALLLFTTVLTGFAYQDTPWPPGLQSVPDESPILSPEEAMTTFFMPPGYRLELVASEPLIQEPVVIDWDSDGRLWVVEMPAYMRDLPGTNEREPSGRVSVLEDTNGDGRMDRKTVFLDNLVLPRALKVLESGVLVGEPPNLWFARDTNGDLRADTKELVTDTYGQELGNVEHNANTLLWALDNWIHTSEVDTFLRLKDGRFEVRKTLSRGQWGASQDDAGRVYRNTNQAALFVDLVPTPYFTRNPALLRTRGSYETLDTGDLNTTWPARPTPAVNRGYQDGILRPDRTLASYTAVCAPTVFRGDRLPAELHGNVFVAEPAANLVSRIIVEDDGTTLRGRKAYERAEFLASTDERFRPVWLSSAPDGTLYIVDMYHGIIQHRGYVTEYLRDQTVARKLDNPVGTGHGRIYRVVHETTTRGPAPALSRTSSVDLVDVLAHPNGWWRDTAQRVLVERGDRTVAARLKERAEGAPDWRTRLHAMWTLDGLDRIEPSTVTRALEDSVRDVRVAALRLSERWLGEPAHPVQAAVLRLLDDKDWAVRRQLAATLGELPDTAKVAPLTTLLERHATDPVTADAALSSLTGKELDVLRRMLRTADATPQRGAAVTLLTATIVRSGRADAVRELLQIGEEANLADWQLDALLAGGESALLNAPLPGSSRRGGGRGGAAAPNTEPGGRAGSGGAPAFAATRNNAASRAGRGAAPKPVPVPREPTGLIELANGGGDLGKRAEALLARMTWPGKPGAEQAAQAAAPLTPDEQKRYEQGQTVYRNLCMACHQENGAGMEKLAPTLIGSPFALGAARVPILVVHNGKEGPTGLMPPLGMTFTDEQVAAVLTYIRRSWGNQASAVTPAEVGAARKEHADRTRPWTEAELTKMVEEGK